MVRRVLNGPCAGGHEGQVISEDNSHGPNSRFVLGPSKREGPTLKSLHITHRMLACTDDWVRGAVG